MKSTIEKETGTIVMHRPLKVGYNIIVNGVNLTVTNVVIVHAANRKFRFKKIFIKAWRCIVRFFKNILH